MTDFKAGLSSMTGLGVAVAQLYKLPNRGDAPAGGADPAGLGGNPNLGGAHSAATAPPLEARPPTAQAGGEVRQTAATGAPSQFSLGLESRIRHAEDQMTLAQKASEEADTAINQAGELASTAEVAEAWANEKMTEVEVAQEALRAALDMHKNASEEAKVARETAASARTIALSRQRQAVSASVRAAMAQQEVTFEAQQMLSMYAGGGGGQNASEPAAPAPYQAHGPAFHGRGSAETIVPPQQQQQQPSMGMGMGVGTPGAGGSGTSAPPWQQRQQQQPQSAPPVESMPAAGYGFRDPFEVPAAAEPPATTGSVATGGGAPPENTPRLRSLERLREDEARVEERRRKHLEAEAAREAAEAHTGDLRDAARRRFHEELSPYSPEVHQLRPEMAVRPQMAAKCAKAGDVCNMLCTVDCLRECACGVLLAIGLGAPARNPTTEQLRASLKKAAVKFHPDRNARRGEEHAAYCEEVSKTISLIQNLFEEAAHLHLLVGTPSVKFKIRVARDEAVLSVKARIAEEDPALPPPQQVLMCEGTELADGRTLADYPEVLDLSILSATPRPQQAGATATPVQWAQFS